MVYRDIRKAEQRQQLDRATWAGIYELAQQFVLYGRGEYLMEEPFFFGTAFEEAPFMTYAITRRGGPAATPDVRTVGHPSKQVLRAGKHRGTLNNVIEDGSFEGYGIGGGVGYPLMTPAEATSDLPYLPGEVYSQRATFWVQMHDGGNKWVGANDRSYHGQYSIKTTLAAGQTSTRRIMPFERDKMEIGGVTDSFPVTEDGFFSWYSMDPAYFRDPHSNPVNWSNEVIAHVYSEEPCELWMWAEIGGIVDYRVKIGDIEENIYEPQPLIEHEITHQIDAGRWNEVSLEFPTPYYDVFCAGLGTFQIARVMLQARNATPGTSVWIDDVWNNSNYKTEANVLITVGVAEWEIDDQGKYIGARLWFKIGDIVEPPCVAVATELEPPL